MITKPTEPTGSLILGFCDISISVITRLFTTTKRYQIGEGREIRNFISKERAHVMRKPCSIPPGGFDNRPLKIAEQHNVSVTRDNFETYYSVKPVISETRLRRDDFDHKC